MKIKLYSKLLVMVTAVVILVGCSEKQEYAQAVLEEMQRDQDVKDYKIDPAEISDCVVQTTSAKMPGIVPIDPMRKEAYKSYTKMIGMSKSTDMKKTMDELRAAFGSPKGLAEAHSNYAESVVECMSGLVSEGEKPKE